MVTFGPRIFHPGFFTLPSKDAMPGGAYRTTHALNLGQVGKNQNEFELHKASITAPKTGIPHWVAAVETE